MDRVVFGSVEKVTLLPSGVTVDAKVDTGAWSGALHCTDIREESGRLHYSPIGDPELATSTSEYRIRKVLSASGHAVKRYIIPIDIEVQGRVYRTDIGLSDRALLNREMLIGRRFLIENDIIVDVKLSLDDDHEAEKYL